MTVVTPGLVVSVSLLVGAYLAWRRMARAGSPLFQIGYFLYTRTRIGYFYYWRELRKAREKFQGGGHSKVTPVKYEGLSITPIPMSLDNYGYLVTDTKTNTSVLIDPADTQSVQKVLDKDSIVPAAVLTTHKHWDHSGGNSHWKSRFSGIQIYGGALDRVPGATRGVADGDMLEFGQLRFRAMFTPGHTVGHCVYVLDGTPFSAPSSLFSGDMLFIGGCGRMFEGPPTTMLRSLDRILELPEETLLWPGHEYASDNLHFACHVQPDNQAAVTKFEWIQEKRKQNFGTIPSTLAEEKTYNPFLRTAEVSQLQALGIETDSTDDLEQTRSRALAALRERKDKFNYKL